LKPNANYIELYVILILNKLQALIRIGGMHLLKLLNLLKKIRQDAGLTQIQLAEKLGESQSYVSKYENGEQRLDLFELEKICEATGVGLVSFITMYIQ
jgi:predicted transcriptional regulator